MIHHSPVVTVYKIISTMWQRLAWLAILGLIAPVTGSCILKNIVETERNYVWFECFRSTNYIADLQMIPNDLSNFYLIFTTSTITKLHNDSFIQFGKNLTALGILYCGLSEIEDYAFQGLTNLNTLVLGKNRLKILKAIWFESLENLEELSVQNNLITFIEPKIFTWIPRLNWLDVAQNQLLYLNVDMLAKLSNLTLLEFQFNPFTWKCRAMIIEWLYTKEVPWDIMTNLDGIEDTYNVTMECLKNEPDAQTNETVLNSCIETKLVEAIVNV